MQIQAVATGLVAIVVAILVIGLVAVPVIEDSTSGTPYEGTNSEPVANYSYLDSSPTFSWARNGGSSVLTLDGKTIASGTNTVDAMVVTDSFWLINLSSGFQVWDVTTNRYTAVSDASAPLTLSVSSGAYTLAYNDTSYTGTITWALVMNSEGDWGMYSGAVKATLGQEILAGHLRSDGEYSGPKAIWSLTDGVVSQKLGPYINAGNAIGPGTATLSVTYQQTGDGQAVGQYSAMTTTWEGGSSDNVRFWAPVGFESTASGDGGMNGTLLAIIPTLLIMVGIMMAVRMVREA